MKRYNLELLKKLFFFSFQKDKKKLFSKYKLKKSFSELGLIPPLHLPPVSDFRFPFFCFFSSSSPQFQFSVFFGFFSSIFLIFFIFFFRFSVFVFFLFFFFFFSSFMTSFLFLVLKNGKFLLKKNWWKTLNWMELG